MRDRRAATLAELLVVMSACSVILTLSASLVYRAMHSHTQSRSFLDIERNAVRLRHQFRLDVEQSHDYTIEKPGEAQAVFVRLTLADGQVVEYRQEDEIVVRVLLQREQIVAREEFLFPEVVEISIREEKNPRRLVLSITTDPTETLNEKAQRMSAYTIPVMLQVAARVNRQGRFPSTKLLQEE